MINLCILFFVVNSTSVKTLGNTGVDITFSMDNAARGAVVFSEAVYLHDEGEPDLPSVLYKVGIPQDADVEIIVSESREEVMKNITIDPVIYAGIYEGRESDVYAFRSDVYQENELFPESMYEVSQPGYFRDIYTIDIRLNPVRYNPVTKELRVSQHIAVHIRFKEKPKIKPILDPSFEEIYKKTIINYEQCKSWRREPLRNGTNPFASGVWFKIEVDEEGLYCLDYSEIQDAGLDPAQFDPQTMKIYTAAFDLLSTDVVSPFADSLIEVPVYVEGEADHSFDAGDYLMFYGYPASHFVPDSEVTWFENGYALNNVYWFTFGGAGGKRMETVDAQWNGETSHTTVTDVLHIEDDVGNPTRSGINWYWQDISPGEGPSGIGSVTIEHPRADGDAQVTVGIFTLNPGTWRYQLALDSLVFFSDTLDIGTHNSWPPYYLVGSTTLFGDSSTLTITITRPPGTFGNLTAYLNGIDMQYERSTDMNVPFHALYQTPQNYSIQCSQVNSTAFVLDITNLQNPKMLSNLSLENNTLHLSGECDSFQLLYFSTRTLAKSAELIPTVAGTLRDQLPGCEYLFITHKNFSNAIMPLVDYRRNEYTTMVISVDDIFNDFSFGKFDPLAIKHFLYYTTNNWVTVPTYVLLVGDAAYDYKNNLNKESPPNFIPMYESGTTLSGNPGIPPNHIYEGEYVNFGAGETMILGRITVRTHQEVRDFINKLFTYETGTIDGMWNKRIILAGDDEHANVGGGTWEGPSLHCGACESILTHTPDSLYDFAKVYMVSYPPFSYPTKKPNAEKAFIQELNKGCLAGVFMGHGNTHQLADEGLFFHTDIPQIKNGRRYFLYYFGSCTVGRFDDSDFECIGEQLVRITDGAIGTMAATAGTGCSSNTTIGERLFEYVTDLDTNLTMGESCFLARDGYWGLHYLVFGDPATRLRRIDTQMELSASPDSLRPLEKLYVMSDAPQYFLKGFVRDTSIIALFDETTQDKISGRVLRDVQTGPSTFVPFLYEIDGKEIYQGFWDQDTAVLIVPNIATTHLPVVKLSTFYAGSSGILDSIRIYGNAAISPDQEGPAVAFYDGARRLQDEDWVSEEFTLTGKVSDESGINLLYSVDNARGFSLVVNDDVDNKIDLRNHFMYSKNSYTDGEFHIALDLPQQKDTVTVNSADNNNNQSVQEIILNAETTGQISIENFLIYPNPLQHNQDVWFTFRLTSSGTVNLKIFTIAGRLIKTIDNIVCGAGYNQLAWNTLDDYQDEISNGVYLVKIFVEAESATDDVIEKFIIAR
jgi:hypothetical protein